MNILGCGTDHVHKAHFSQPNGEALITPERVVEDADEVHQKEQKRVEHEKKRSSFLNTLLRGCDR